MENVIDKEIISTEDINGFKYQKFDIGDYNSGWQVLELSEDNELMLISADIIEPQIGGQYDSNTNKNYFWLGKNQGYRNGVDELNRICSYYGKGKGAKVARCININDINKITGYTDTVNNVGEQEVYQSGNSVTYTKGDKGNIYYKGTKYPMEEKVYNHYSDDLQFMFYKDNNLIILKEGESATFFNDAYEYYPQTLSNTESLETNINGNSEAYNLLFNEKFNRGYWLASQCIDLSEFMVGFDMRIISKGKVSFFYMYGTTCEEDWSAGYKGIRPVVILKDNVMLNKNEDGSWDISIK